MYVKCHINFKLKTYENNPTEFNVNLKELNRVSACLLFGSHIDYVNFLEYTNGSKKIIFEIKGKKIDLIEELMCSGFTFHYEDEDNEEYSCFIRNEYTKEIAEFDCKIVALDWWITNAHIFDDFYDEYIES